jgi:hypothetical protein
MMVIGCGGFTVSRVHGTVGAEEHRAYADDQNDDTRPFSPRQVTHRVVGPAGTAAGLGCFDVNSEPQRVEVDEVRLPWSSKIMTALPAGVGDIAAQGDSDRIGRRVVVDGEVRTEWVSNEVSARAHRLVRGA